MSDYLASLVATATAARPALRPRPVTPFEPAPLPEVAAETEAPRPTSAAAETHAEPAVLTAGRPSAPAAPLAAAPTLSALPAAERPGVGAGRPPAFRQEPLSASSPTGSGASDEPARQPAAEEAPVPATASSAPAEVSAAAPNLPTVRASAPFIPKPAQPLRTTTARAPLHPPSSILHHLPTPAAPRPNAVAPAPRAAAAPPPVQITIGRVEVRATVTGGRKPAAAPPTARPANILTLEEHLQRRARRERP